MTVSKISIQSLVRNMEVSGVPGLVFTLIENHQITATQPVGVKNSETKEPAAADTIFQAASLSKPVFAYGALTLQQEGRLDLDRPLDEYLSLPESDVVPQLRQVTARQALTHTTGLQNWRFDSEDQLEFAFEPGTDFSYSGEGFFYLQRVVEKITGQSIEAFLQTRLLRPLGMHDSTYLWRPGLETRISMGHRNHGRKAEPWNLHFGPQLLDLSMQKNKPLEEWSFADFVESMPRLQPPLFPVPNNMIPNVAGSLLTTAPDYAQFLLRLLDPGDEIARQMLVPQHRLNSLLSWGLGIGLESGNDQTCFWHWGDNGMFANFMFGNPATGDGIVILTNDVRGLYLCERILRELNGQELGAFLWI